jgi:hypothetical protein
MGLRLIAVTVACLITWAPVATTACQATCSAREHAAGQTAEHHSCHTPAAADGPAVTAGAHTCGHSDEAPTAIDQLSQMRAVAPAVTVAAFVPIPPSGEAPRLRSAGVEHSPPGLLALNTQLRV